MNRGAPEEPPPQARRDPNVLISLVASTATAALAVLAVGTWHAISERPWTFLTLVGLTFVLQVVAIEVYGKGSFSFGGAGLLAVGFTFGAGPAMVIAALMGVVNMIVRWKKGARLNRGVFDAAQFSLSAGAGTGFYYGIGAQNWSVGARVLPAVGAGAVYMLVNVGLLSLALSLANEESLLAVWRERFRWLTPYYLAAGPLALALTIAYDKLGVTGLLAFTLPPALMMLSTRQYKQSVEDLKVLLAFAGGLSAHTHDLSDLTEFTREAVPQLTGDRGGISVDDDGPCIVLEPRTPRVAALQRLARAFGMENERWQRLAEAMQPQLDTAWESAGRVEEVHAKHKETIRALAQSMGAKDYYKGFYTQEHTDRVSEVAIALAKRLGYADSDLDAIEIGAIIHDVGKIGIPERILHKPGPLDDEEWKVMREHPIISEYILKEIDLHPIVLQMARSSHERMDGKGYPDGLAGDAIPLPARILLVADALDALTSDRPYRSGRSVPAAMEELRTHAGTQFCPAVIEALEVLYREQPQLLGAATLRAVGEAAA